MKGYRKINDGYLFADKIGIECQDNYELDNQIRSTVHSPIIGEVEKSGCEEYFIVVYKKITGDK